jgi:hypothetical protein
VTRTICGYQYEWLANRLPQSRNSSAMLAKWIMSARNGTNSMKLRLSSEATSCSASHIFTILCTQKNGHRVHKSWPLVPIKSQINSIHTVRAYFSRSIFRLSSHTFLGLPKVSPPPPVRNGHDVCVHDAKCKQNARPFLSVIRPGSV